MTEAFVRRCWGKENPIEKEIFRYGKKMTIACIFKGWAGPPNMPFDILLPLTASTWGNTIYQIYIGVQKETNIKAFEKKFYKHVVPVDYYTFEKLNITPITALHYTGPG